MPFHLCPQEIFAIVAALPFLSTGIWWLRSKLSRKTPTPIECCEHPHSHELPEARVVE